MINTTKIREFLDDCKDLQFCEWQSVELGYEFNLNVGLENNGNNGNEYHIEINDTEKDVITDNTYTKNLDTISIDWIYECVLGEVYDRVKTKFGALYFEILGKQEEQDRIKIYDSYGRYLDYFWLEFCGESELEDCKNDLRTKDFNNINDMLNWFGIFCYTASENCEDLIDDIWGNTDYHWDEESAMFITDYDNIPITLERILNSEWVNKIGDYWIAITDR